MKNHFLINISNAFKIQWNAKSAEGKASVNTGVCALAAKSAEGKASANTGRRRTLARSAGGTASVTMGGGALTAKIVQEPTLATKSQGVAKWSLSQR